MDHHEKDFAPEALLCPDAPTVQEMVRARDAEVPEALDLTSNKFLGDADIPSDRYISSEFFQLEMKRLWPRVWQWACREEEIPEEGDYIVYEIGDYSFIVVRTGQGVKAYYNACLHRGTKLRASGSEGCASEFRCPYHGWTWEIGGDLKKIPCEWDFPHVDPKAMSLPEVRVGLWGGFVFINMDEEAESLEDYISPLAEHFQNWNMADRYISSHVQKKVPANWKAVIEAFLEGYHVAETHPTLLKSYVDTNQEYGVYGDHVSRFWSPSGFSSPSINPPMTEQEILEVVTAGDAAKARGEFVLGPGDTARTALARYFRKQLAEEYKVDLARYTDSELIDVIQYFVFPNLIMHASLSVPVVYRFRPMKGDPDNTLFEMFWMRPVPDDGVRPEPPEPMILGDDESFVNVPIMGEAMGEVFDQDINNLRLIQEGVKASHKRSATLANYQEVRIRQMQAAVDKYVSRP